MGGIAGRQTNIAFARATTWGTPASVTQQILLESTEGMDDMPELVDDENFNQDFVGIGEIGDRQALTPTLSTAFRFEQGCDVFVAASMGSSAAPTVVSSQAANSLVAYSHVITMAPALNHFFTLATDMVNYVQEVRSFKVAGFGIKVGDQGRMMCSFPIVADRATYDSTINTNSTVAGATVATPGNKAFRRLTRFRMNMHSDGALSSGDVMNIVSDFEIKTERPLAKDLVLNQDSIIEADDDGFFDASLDLTFARMTSAGANSIQVAYAAGGVFKADVLMTGTYINSTTQRSALLEMPALQVATGGYKAEVVGHGQVRPKVTLKLKLANAAPTGMSGLVNPLRITIVNARSTNLLA